MAVLFCTPRPLTGHFIRHTHLIGAPRRDPVNPIDHFFPPIVGGLFSTQQILKTLSTDNIRYQMRSFVDVVKDKPRTWSFQRNKMSQTCKVLLYIWIMCGEFPPLINLQNAPLWNISYIGFPCDLAHRQHAHWTSHHSVLTLFLEHIWHQQPVSAFVALLIPD